MGFITSIFVFLSLNKWPGNLFSVEEECEHEQLQLCSCVTALGASQEPCLYCEFLESSLTDSKEHAHAPRGAGN